MDLTKQRKQKYFDKLKKENKELWMKEKGLIEIDDPYVGAPLLAYEHTLANNPSDERKLLFKYNDQIRGKQWNTSDIYNKQLGFGKWSEPLGISAFAAAMYTAAHAPPLTVPVAALGAVAASGKTDTLKKLKGDIVDVAKDKKKKYDEKKKKQKEYSQKLKIYKEEVKRKVESDEAKFQIMTASAQALLSDIRDKIDENPSYYLSTIPPDIGLDRIILDVYERGNVARIERAKNINITSLKEYVEQQRGTRTVEGYRNAARFFYDKVKKEYEDKWELGNFDIDEDREGLEKYKKWINLKNKHLPDIWQDALDITRQQKENDTKEEGLIEFIKKVEKVSDGQTLKEIVRLKGRDVDGYIEQWIDTFNEARLVNQLPRVEMEIMHTNPIDPNLSKVRARVGGINGTIFLGETKSNEPRPPAPAASALAPPPAVAAAASAAPPAAVPIAPAPPAAAHIAPAPPAAAPIAPAPPAAAAEPRPPSTPYPQPPPRRRHRTPRTIRRRSNISGGNNKNTRRRKLRIHRKKTRRSYK
tara:strand:- start:544 stop:2130 length:1587 start_codon:yes stop_codon:yes gene_type:complete